MTDDSNAGPPPAMIVRPRRVCVADAVDLLQPGIDLLHDDGVQVSLPPAAPAAESVDEFLARSTGAPVAVVGLRPIGAAEVQRLAAGGTRLIIRPGIGYDIIDVAAATAAGITVANVPDYCVDEVADHTMLLLLAAQRRLDRLGELWRSGWHVAEQLPTVSRISGSVLGIVGFGRIGRAVARRAIGFGWRVLVCDPNVDVAGVSAALGADIAEVDLDELFSVASAVTLHCPLSPDNHHLVNAERLARMRPGSILVNTSRGGLVNLDAVDVAVAAGRLGAVGLDVLDGEPDPPLDHPLLRRPAVTITPHVAWYSLDSRRELAVRTAQEALSWFDDATVRNPVNVVAGAPR